MDFVRSPLGRRVDSETLSSSGVELSLGLGDRWSAGLGADARMWTQVAVEHIKGEEEWSCEHRRKEGMEGRKRACQSARLEKISRRESKAYTVTESQSDIVCKR
jgi:hypothetical protein